MADDPLSIVRGQLGERIAELQARVPDLSPLAIYARMDAIRAVAAEYGLVALEGLADCSAHRAMMPGMPRRDPQLPRAYGRSDAEQLARRPHHHPRRHRGSVALSNRPRAASLNGAMRAFSQLLDDLVYTRSRNTKLALIGDYLKATPDPDRGIALAALTGTLDIPAVKPAAIRALAEERIDPVLLRMSRDYVGDMAETVSLLWPVPTSEPPDMDDGTIRISDAVERLRLTSRAEAPREVAQMLDHLDVSGRFALLKLATGALRVGISARLAKQALADAFALDVEQVEEVWHGLRPPFTELFDWGEGRAGQPQVRDLPVFRPFMLATALDDLRVSLDDYAAEWKWDGIRIQLVHAGGETRLYSRTGDDISAQLPRRGGGLFNPGRARRRTAGARDRPGRRRSMAAPRRASTRSSNGLAARSSARRCREDYPAFVRLYDILFDGEEDLRALALDRAPRAARSAWSRGSTPTASTCRN